MMVCKLCKYYLSCSILPYALSLCSLEKFSAYVIILQVKRKRLILILFPLPFGLLPCLALYNFLVQDFLVQREGY